MNIIRNKVKYFIIAAILILPFIFAKAFAAVYYDGKFGIQKYGEDKPYTTQNASYDEEILFIIDFSASMNQKMGYQPKVFLAVDALRSILYSSKDSTKIGLRVFGMSDGLFQGRYRNATERKEKMCRASRLYLPIARYNSHHISNKIGTLRPHGATPIGYSLRQAIQNDFSPNATLKRIILITDGGENCGDVPCEYVRSIMQLRDDIRIDVIAITVGKADYQELNCIATYGKGNYYSVNDPEQFKIKFKEAFEAKHYSRPSSSNVNITKPQPIASPVVNERGVKYKNYLLEFDN